MLVYCPKLVTFTLINIINSPMKDRLDSLSALMYEIYSLECYAEYEKNRLRLAENKTLTKTVRCTIR